MKVIIVKSTIKGYHIFRGRPHSAIEMFVNKEFGNPKDSDAMTVDIPVLGNILKSSHVFEYQTLLEELESPQTENKKNQGGARGFTK